jgi:hypothetical protein
MFESQNQWFDHETRFHRKQWQCKLCNAGSPMLRSDLEIHTKDYHASLVSDETLDSILDQCTVERIDATSCPLCTEYGARLQRINQSTKCDVSLKQFQEHLGRHMEQLALAALPEDEGDDEQDDDLMDLSSNSESEHIEQHIRASKEHGYDIKTYLGPSVPSQTTTDAMERFRKYADTISIASRAASWGTRRASLSSITSQEAKPSTARRLTTSFRRLFRDAANSDDEDAGLESTKVSDFAEIPDESMQSTSQLQHGRLSGSGRLRTAEERDMSQQGEFLERRYSGGYLKHRLE